MLSTFRRVFHFIAIASAAATSLLAAGRAPAATNAQRVVLEITDEDAGPTPARFSVYVSGQPHELATLNDHGLRFVSVHRAKQEKHVATYARGTGPVEFTLPAGVGEVAVHVAKGFEYRPLTFTVPLTSPETRVIARLKRWSNLAADGWTTTDEHVHYDRIDPEADRDWMTMMAADDLSHAHFLMAKGGQVPGEWAVQRAYGAAGEAMEGGRHIVPGEEYRDNAQGHVNLLGVDKVIEPVMTGTVGHPENYPPLHQVLQRAREHGSFNGVAHGAALGTTTTALMDTILGVVDFFEISNPHLFVPELWYDLMNCGYALPPAGGTDLPNFGGRDPWQPFLGSVRMYVRMGAGARNFKAWRHAVEHSEVFVTAGPLITFTVNGRRSGSVLHLDAPSEVEVLAELAAAKPLQAFELVVNGQTKPAVLEQRIVDGIHRWTLRARVNVEESSWLAVRGRGTGIHALKMEPSLRFRPHTTTDAMAHSNAVRVIISKRAILKRSSLESLLQRLNEAEIYYRERGVFADASQREEMLSLFQRARSKLAARGAEPP